MHPHLGNVLAILCVLGLIGVWVVLGWIHGLVGYEDSRPGPRPTVTVTAHP